MEIGDAFRIENKKNESLRANGSDVAPRNLGIQGQVTSVQQQVRTFRHSGTNPRPVRFAKAIKSGEYSISEDVLNRKFYEKKTPYTVKERLEEREGH